VVMVPEPADPKATAANVPITATATPAVSRRWCFFSILSMTLLAFLSVASLLLRGRDGLDDAAGVEPGLPRHERGVPARRRAEHEEADLVIGDMDRAVEADAGAGPRQLLGGRVCPCLACDSFSCVPASEECFDEVARHAVDATLGLRDGTRQNV